MALHLKECGRVFTYRVFLNKQRSKLRDPSHFRARYRWRPLTSVNFYVLDTLSERNPLGERDNRRFIALCRLN